MPSNSQFSTLHFPLLIVSQPFNPDVANAFFRTAFLESWGRGIDLIRQSCQAHGAPEPRLEWDNGLWVVFPFASGWVAEGVTPPVAPPVTPPVTQPVVVLLRLLEQAGALGNAEIRACLGLKDRGHLRERYLSPALAEAFIEHTIPEKPQSRLQRYRLTAKGAAALAALGKERTFP